MTPPPTPAPLSAEEITELQSLHKLASERGPSTAVWGEFAYACLEAFPRLLATLELLAWVEANCGIYSRRDGTSYWSLDDLRAAKEAADGKP